MNEYKVKSNLKYNGQLYKKGDLVKLNEDIANQLVRDNVLAHMEDMEDMERESAQPAVNNVKRKGENVDGEMKVEPGKVEKPQPGDDMEDGEESAKLDLENMSLKELKAEAEKRGLKKTGTIEELIGRIRESEEKDLEIDEL